MIDSPASTGWRAPALAVLLTYVAAVTAGVIVGMGVYALTMSSAPPNAKFAELGAAMYGVLAGGPVAVVTYVVVGVLALRRALPTTERVRGITALMGAPVLQVGVLTLFPSLGQTEALLVAAPALLVIAALPWLLVLGVTGRLSRHALLIPFVVAAVSIAAAVPVQAAAHRAERLERLQKWGHPLALVDGTSTEAGGWQLAKAYAPYSETSSVSVPLRAAERRAELEFHAEHIPPCGEYEICRQIGTTEYGPVQERMYSSSTASPRIYAEVPGGHWEVSGMHSSHEALRLLQRLRPVDATTFHEALN